MAWRCSLPRNTVISPGRPGPDSPHVTASRTRCAVACVAGTPGFPQRWGRHTREWRESGEPTHISAWQIQHWLNTYPGSDHLYTLACLICWCAVRKCRRCLAEAGTETQRGRRARPEPLSRYSRVSGRHRGSLWNGEVQATTRFSRVFFQNICTFWTSLCYFTTPYIVGNWWECKPFLSMKMQMVLIFGEAIDYCPVHTELFANLFAKPFPVPDCLSMHILWILRWICVYILLVFSLIDEWNKILDIYSLNISTRVMVLPLF